MSITIKDVSRKAGFSTATVSRVLNNSERVHVDTRDKVLSAIETLGYKPSRLARNLRTQSTQLIGLIISDIQNPFFTSVIQGAEDKAHENDYSLILCNSNEDPNREKIYLDIMMNEKVAGVILATTLGEGQVEDRFINETPIVAIDRLVSEDSFDEITVDNEQGAYEAVSHLLELGHRRIGFINGLPYVSVARERRAGYVKAHIQHGVPTITSLMRTGNFKQESGYQIALDLLTGPNPPTALFVANNLMTLGALNAIHSLSLDIPDNVAIVGFDDLPWAESLNPPLTVVAQPAYELGMTAVELLLMRLSGDRQPPIRICMSSDLVIRESCGGKLSESPA